MRHVSPEVGSHLKKAALIILLAVVSAYTVLTLGMLVVAVLAY
ncbi:MAG: hypothetical protein ACXWJN_09915 [Methyloceanibacter sp.]|jgi:hypothetical protein